MSFQRWFRARPAQNQGAPRVLLWADTFNNYFTPETAQAAVCVLEDAGFQVVVPRGHLCCGRPLYDYGFLDRARIYLRARARGAARRDRGAHAQWSCSSRAAPPSSATSSATCSPSDGQARTAPPEHLPAQRAAHELARALGYQPPRLARRALVQGHCHHKAIMRMDAERQVLEPDGGRTPRCSPPGAAGWPGSFGYEEGEHHQVSLAVGERVLLPAVRGAPPDTLILADGFSCKQQIAQATDRRALHLAEAMAMALEHGPEGIAGALPRAIGDAAASRPQRRSMRRAGAVVLAIGAAAGFVAWSRRRS